VTLTMTLSGHTAYSYCHTVMHHSSTSTYIPNVVEIEETFLWTDGRTNGWADGYFSTHVIRSTRRSRPKK